MEWLVKNEATEGNSLKIREIKKEEVPLLKIFTYYSLFVPEGTDDFSKDILELLELKIYYRNFDIEKDLALLAEVDSEIVGAIWGIYWSQYNAGYGYYKDSYLEISMSILPAYRSKGIGSKLLEEFIRFAKTHKVQGLSLSVNPANFAKEMYEKKGFEVVESRATDILMKINLI